MGSSCLLTTRVTGSRRVPEPPARMMPFMRSSPDGQAEALQLVLAARDVLAPLRVIQIPLDRAAQPALEALARRPAQLPLDLARIDRIPVIVARTVLHERDQAVMAACRIRRNLVEDRA